jgi:hypothetical protein
MIITEKIKKFKEIEKIIYEQVCKLGIELIELIIEDMDWQVMESRDKEQYRHKGFSKTTVKTIMGEVEYNRRVYTSEAAINGKHCHYLLDEELGLAGKIGQLSENLVEIIAGLCIELPYRKASSALSEISNQPLSAMGIWGMVQKLGEELVEQEKGASMRAKKHEGHGTVETKVLFEENDLPAGRQAESICRCKRSHEKSEVAMRS